MRHTLKLLLLLAVPALGQTAAVKLNWTASTTPAAQISRYTIYRSTVSGQYSPTNWIGNSGTAATTTYTDTITLTAAPQTFYYVARTQLADLKTESVNSNEWKVSIPALSAVPNPPTKLNCTITITGAAVSGTCQ